MTRKLIATVLAASMALTAFSTAPARALDSGETARLILGVGTLFALGHVIGKNTRAPSRHVNRNNVYNPGPRYNNSNAIVVPAYCVHGHGQNRWVDWNCVRSSGY